MPAVISDTSCLIFLAKIGQLDLLPALFEQIWLPPAVVAEYSRPLPAWTVVAQNAVLPSPAQVPERFGLGERSAIGLALMKADCVLIIDDKEPKRIAQALGISCIGTLGILKLAKEAGHVTAIRPLIYQLRTVAGMWLTDAVAERVCRDADE